MIFNTKSDAQKWFRKYKLLNNLNELKFAYENNELNIQFGDWFLFQHVNGNENTISRPILGICTGYDVWDMALVLNFIEQPRAWINHHQYISNKESNYASYICTPIEIDYVEFWNDEINLLGIWKVKPSLNELKIALSNQI